MSSEVVKTKLTSIDFNPFRKLAVYPFNADKIAALRQSIRDVGLWEGVIARKAGNRVQIAFGHHRIEAARQELGPTAGVPIILRDLSDEQMLQFMGRENLEDYNADFLSMLETWEAAGSFLADRGRQNPEPIELAALLGWIDAKRQSKPVARACANASQLIDAGHIKRQELVGLSVKSVREICEHALTRQRQLEAMAKKTGRSAREVEGAKRDVGRAAGEVARKVRQGKIAQREIRGHVDVGAYRHAKEAKRAQPLFSKFADGLAETISRMLQSDSASERMTEIKKALGHIETDEDVKSVEKIEFELRHLTTRSEKWQRVFANPTKKVVKLKEIK